MLHISELLYWLRLKREERRRMLTSTKGNAKSAVFKHDLSLPIFEGFPYLLTRLVPSFYHISLLPEALSRQDLLDVGANQFEYNRLNCCLVYGWEDCCYFSEDHSIVPSSDPPRGGCIVSDPVLLPFAPTRSTDFDERVSLLKLFEAQQRPVGYSMQFEELIRIGVRATKEQNNLLKGLNLAGVPRGLSQCPFCREWRGWCLDPEQVLDEIVVRISCRCENNNYCARCRRQLAARKLNSNRYNINDGLIWHFPAYLALKHRCQIIQQRQPDQRSHQTI